jgi:hypothetical protein
LPDPTASDQVALGSSGATVIACGTGGFSCSRTQLSLGSLSLRVNNSVGASGQLLISTGNGCAWGAGSAITTSGTLSGTPATLTVANGALTVNLPVGPTLVGTVAYFKSVGPTISLNTSGASIFGLGDVTPSVSLTIPVNDQAAFVADASYWYQFA